MSPLTIDEDLCAIAREVRTLIGVGHLGDAQRRLDDLIALLDDMAGLGDTDGTVAQHKPADLSMTDAPPRPSG